MKKIIIYLFLTLSMLALNTVWFTIEPNSINGVAFSWLIKYINVLNCFFIIAENNISVEKVLYAAAAELLDNNEYGIVDDSLVKNRLQNQQASIPIFTYEASNAEN